MHISLINFGNSCEIDCVFCGESYKIVFGYDKNSSRNNNTAEPKCESVLIFIAFVFITKIAIVTTVNSTMKAHLQKPQNDCIKKLTTKFLAHVEETTSGYSSKNMLEYTVGLEKATNTEYMVSSTLSNSYTTIDRQNFLFTKL